MTEYAETRITQRRTEAGVGARTRNTRDIKQHTEYPSVGIVGRVQTTADALGVDTGIHHFLEPPLIGDIA